MRSLGVAGTLIGENTALAHLAQAEQGSGVQNAVVGRIEDEVDLEDTRLENLKSGRAQELASCGGVGDGNFDFVLAIAGFTALHRETYGWLARNRPALRAKCGPIRRA